MSLPPPPPQKRCAGGVSSHNRYGVPLFSRSALQHTATHFNTLQHTSTHYNTLIQRKRMLLLFEILTSQQTQFETIILKQSSFHGLPATLQPSIFVQLKSWNSSNCQISTFNLINRQLETSSFHDVTNCTFQLLVKLQFCNLSNQHSETCKFPRFDQLQLSTFVKLTL